MVLPALRLWTTGSLLSLVIVLIKSKTLLGFDFPGPGAFFFEVREGEIIAMDKLSCFGQAGAGCCFVLRQNVDH